MLNFNDKKGFICDMDGVIYHGNKILPGVPEFIDWLQRTGKEYLFLTNNSGCTPLELKQKLARMGLDVPEARFYTSALATAAFIRDQSPGCSAYVIGEAGLLNALYDAGITMNDVNPDYVIVGEGRNYSLDSLTKATNLVQSSSARIPTFPAPSKTASCLPAARSSRPLRWRPARRRTSAASRTR